MSTQYLSNDQIAKFLEQFKKQLSKDQTVLIKAITEAGFNLRLDSFRTITPSLSGSKVVHSYIFYFSTKGATCEISITF
jgi:hypothetical protein